MKSARDEGGRPMMHCHGRRRPVRSTGLRLALGPGRARTIFKLSPKLSAAPLLGARRAQGAPERQVDSTRHWARAQRRGGWWCGRPASRVISLCVGRPAGLRAVPPAERWDDDGAALPGRPLRRGLAGQIFKNFINVRAGGRADGRARQQSTISPADNWRRVRPFSPAALGRHSN